ncbi:hypothetical protein H0H81_008136 [Sphagnurus paluster]|uniref:Uncharacterized protein n=1 Tax=Sphagnurus paluster TaxID=117069 RepID=A0A9P7GRA1_9AGAR|nr:hypothetical protein H0H81_008136 [Sphagnurus paluster]
MSKANSRWGMVGMLMGTSRLRSASKKRKDTKGSIDASSLRNGEAPGQPLQGTRVGTREGSMAEVMKVEEPTDAVLSRAVSQEDLGRTSDLEASLADEQLYSLVPRPNITEATRVDEPLALPSSTGSPGDLGRTSEVEASLAEEQFYKAVSERRSSEDHDQGWTDVTVRQQSTPPLSSESTKPTAPPETSKPVATNDVVEPSQKAPNNALALLEQKLENKNTEMTGLELAKKELEDRLAALQSDLASARAETGQLRVEKDQQAQNTKLLEAAAQRREEELAEAKRNKETAARDLEDGGRRVTALEGDLAAQVEAIMRVREELLGAKDALAEVERKRDEVTQDLEDARRKVTGLEADLAAQAEARIRAENDLAEVKTKAENDLVEVKRSRDEATRSLDDAQRRVRALEEDLAAQVGANRRVENELTKAKESGEGVARDLETARRRVAVLEEDLAVQAETMSNIEDELAKTKETGAGAARDLEDARRRAEVLEDNLAAQAKAMDRVKDELTKTKESGEGVARDLVDARRRAKALEDNLAAQAKAMARVEDELMKAKRSGEAAGRDLENSRRRIQAFEKDLAAQTEAKKGLRDELVEALQDLEMVRRRLEESEKRGVDVEVQHRDLVEKHRNGEEELQRVQGLHTETSKALVAAHTNVASLREELEAAQSSLNKDTKRNEELEDVVAELERTNEELQGLGDQYTRAVDALDSACTQVESLSDENSKLRSQLASSAAVLAEKEKEIQKLQRRSETIKQPNDHDLQLEALTRQNRMLHDQLRRQSDELRQKTFPRPDARNGTVSSKGDVAAAITSMIDRLNADIFQAAAHMADTLDFSNTIYDGAVESRGVLERASVTMGKPLAVALQAISGRTQDDFNPLPVQIGLQACLVSCCARIISSWCPGDWEYGDFLSAIYHRLVGTTPPNIAVKWRALTERQLKNPSDKAVQVEMEEYVLRNLVDALVISGWRKTQSNGRDLLAKFRERLSQIVKVALRLNVALVDDWEATVIYPDDPFDTEAMEDAYDWGQESDYVVCTTDLGLKMAGSIVLKPKVVIREMLAEETGYDFSSD